ncbi:HNH endonuclease [Acinetobacter radioresistens]|uniref:HNH endonuclease n=1 Tax=Acinetobacter radioresistens TaxID=40216 RepID=UPI0021CDE29F|nr:HNH endonuclease [Acinetobacter radioresistens]MCU4310000.1 HNH endonuclease [Acinetobacter radioresistens]
MTADNSALLSFVSKAKTKSYKQPEWKHPKPCVICGELFLPYQKRSVVCSQDCRLVHVANNSRTKWQVKDYPEVNCHVCNTVFKPRQKNSKYCSRKCSNNKPRYKVLTCIQCKGEIKRFSHGSRDAGLCCSRECGFKWQAFIRSEIRALRRIAENNKPKPVVNTYVINEIRAIKRIARAARVSKSCKHCGEIVYSKYLLLHPNCRKEYEKTVRLAYRQKYKHTEVYKANKKVWRNKRKALERGAKVAENVNPDLILERDKYRCYICGIKTPKKLRGTYEDSAPEVDHIIPLSKGGLHVESNLRCACRKCNGLKSDRVYKLI